MTVEAVVFDVGETLIDEARAWTEWAHWLGISSLTFQAVLGAAIERGDDHRAPFRLLRPELDLDAAMLTRADAGSGFGFTPDDLYPDALEGLRCVADAGYRVGVAGNQPEQTETMLHDLGVRLDLVASSASLGAPKPDLAFFAAIVDRLGLPPAAIAYVGDRLDNDVRPAAAAGMVAVFVRRGPWAWIQAGRTDPPEATVVVDSLLEIPDALRRLG
jgi:FMN phosphatase YigB (HAD superfamily)